MDFLSRSVNYEYLLTDLEDDIVTYIKKHKKRVIEMKIVELASTFYTVPNTITRLCHKLKYSGFAEMKIELKRELYESDLPHPLQKEILLRNLALIDERREQKVVQILKNSHLVNFYSIGQTAYATKIFVDNFYAVDYKFKFYTYANELRHKIETAENEVFFFVSLSGEKEQILTLSEQAKKTNHTVISLTGLTPNSLARIADINLFCYSPEEVINNYNITDKTPLLIIMNSLFHAYIQ